MKIYTERLELAALTAGQLKLLLDDLPALEAELECSYKAEPLEGPFVEILRNQLAPTEAAGESYFWHSFWLIIRKEDRTVVGSADFKNAPDENGSVELGYGLGARFEGRGYMTEAARAMCEWALARPEARLVTADTEPDNLASQRVLLRCGFTESGRGALVHWQLRRTDGRC